MSMPTFGGSWLPIWRPSKLTNFKKCFDLTHRQKICMASILTNDTIFDAGNTTKRIQQLKNAYRFMDRKAEKVKNLIFREFQPILRYCYGTLSKFYQTFCINRYHCMFPKNWKIDILIKSCFSMTNKCANFGLKTRHND